MHKLNMALDSTSGTVDIVSDGGNDALLGGSFSNRWGIDYYDGGYVLKSANIDSNAMRCTAVYPGADIFTAAFNSTYSNFKWSLEAIPGLFIYDSFTNTPYDGTTLIDVEMDQPSTLNAIGLKVFTGIESAINWYSNDTSIASVVSASGTITGYKRDNVTITATSIHNGITYQVQYIANVIETIYVVNLYDSTLENDTDKLNNISKAVDFLNIVYEDEFNLHFVMDGAPVQYANAAVDVCPLGDQECNEQCGDFCCDTHHKNIFTIAKSIYREKFERNHLVVMWSDSPAWTFCASFSIEHSTTKALACVVAPYGPPIPVVQVLTIHESTDNGEAFMAINLAHEVAHTLGLREIYRNDYSDDATYEGIPQHGNTANQYFRCIMKSYDGFNPVDFYNQALVGHERPLCTYCSQKLHSEIPSNAYES